LVALLIVVFGNDGSISAAQKQAKAARAAAMAAASEA
jgi:hypothetical protein